MKKIVYKPIDSALAFLLAIFFQVVLLLGFTIFLALYSGFTGTVLQDVIYSNLGRILTIILAEGAFLLVFVLLNFFKQYDGITAAKINKPFSWQNLVVCIVIALVVLFGFLGIANLIDMLVTLIGYPVVSELPLPLTNFWWLLLSIFLFAILPAIAEEVLFRGIILTGFLSLGRKKAVLFSALLFMLIHGNIQQTFYQFLFGIILGIIFIKTASLWCVIVAHFVNNLVVILFQYFTQNVPVEIAEFSVSQLVWAFVTAAISFVAIYLLFKLLKKAKRKTKQKFVEDPISGNLVLESEITQDIPVGISFNQDLSIKVHSIAEEKNKFNNLEDSAKIKEKMTYNTKALLYFGFGLSVLIWISDLVTEITST